MAKRQRAWEHDCERNSGIAAPQSWLSKLQHIAFYAAETAPCSPPPPPPPPPAPHHEHSPQKQAKTVQAQHQQASSSVYKLEGNSHHDVLSALVELIPSFISVLSAKHHYARLTLAHADDSEDEREQPRTGERIGTYVLKEMLGVGGFGKVYRACPIGKSGRSVALKANPFLLVRASSLKILLTLRVTLL